MISVVITAYNAERFIKASIRSILAQSHTDLQCIVVDDGSTDGTYKIAMGMAKKDRRVLVRKAGRVGRGRALNIGWRAAKGEYVAIQDADDVSHPHRLEIEWMHLMGSENGLAGVGSTHKIIGPKDTRRIKWALPGILDVDYIDSGLPFRNPVSHPSLMLKRTALVSVGGYDETRQSLLDWDLLVRLHAMGFVVGKFIVPLVAHRIHPGQFFEGQKRFRYAWHCAQMQWRAIRALGRSPFLALTIPPLFVYRLLPRVLR